MEKLEGMVALESADAYIFYNAMIRDLNNHCIRYLDMLNTGRYDVKGGTTKLDRYRVNFCRNEIENILKRIKMTGQLPNNNYIRIAMVHGYQYLGKLKKLREDVSRFALRFLTTNIHYDSNEKRKRKYFDLNGMIVSFFLFNLILKETIRKRLFVLFYKAIKKFHRYFLSTSIAFWNFLWNFF